MSPFSVIEGENVVGEVGRNLIVSSVPSTGKVSGREFDLSATVTVGYGVSVSGSVGYGQTTGKTEWVDRQTSIVARDELDIRTENHTQIDGALIASQTGNLKLDTDTLGFRDIKGEDKEHSYYLNVGGSYGTGQQDSSQSGKGESGANGWSLEGYDYSKEREQIVRATVGEGEIVVRRDAETGQESTAGLNRDVSEAYEITKDDEERTDLYVSESSVEAMSNPKATVKQWAHALATYDETAKANLDQISVGLNVTYNRLEKALGRELPSGAQETGGADIAEAALEAMLLKGKSLSEAKSLLADEGFQQGLLAQIKALDDLSKIGMITLLHIDEESGEWVESASSTNRVTPQKVLRRLAVINNYLEGNPDAATALAWSMAAMQGPKAVVQLAAEQALGATELGQRFTEYVAELQYELGKHVAEKIEHKDLFEEEIKDKLLIGGGNLLVSIITGGVPVGGAGGAGSKVVTIKERGETTSNGNSIAPQTSSGSSSVRADGLPVEQVPVGSKGNWDRAVNGDLKPHTAYELSNGHTYITDASGRVSSVEGKLDLTKMERNKYQQCKVGHCGDPGDDGGHLIASSLGGAGDKINIVPQASTLNRGDWKAMENSLRKDLEAGKSVSVKVEVKYPPSDGVRPSEFRVLATIDGKLVPFRFEQ